MKRWRHYNKETAIILSAFGSIPEKDRFEQLKVNLQEYFSEHDLYLAFSSRTVLKRLKAKGIVYKNLTQILADLDLAGYRRMIISSVNLYPTDEHEFVKKIVNGFKEFSLANIKATPTIMSKADSANMLLGKLNSQFREKFPDDIHLYIIHGAPYFEQAGFQSILYTRELLQELHPMNFFCALERAFNFDLLKEKFMREFQNISSMQSQQAKQTKIILVPLLLTSGNHFLKDVQKIKAYFKQSFTTELVEPMSGEEHFNLLSLDVVNDIIKKEIDECINKLG